MNSHKFSDILFQICEQTFTDNLVSIVSVNTETYTSASVAPNLSKQKTSFYHSKSFLEVVSQACETFFEILAKEYNRPWNGTVIFLDFWDDSIFGPTEPSLSVQRRRMIAFESLRKAMKKNYPFLLITSEIALSYVSMPLQEYNKSIFNIKLGQNLSRSDALRTLLSLGYHETPTVEDTCTFSFRGEILDFYPPQYLHPLRIEFFDDEVERIRAFDPQSQRSLTNNYDEVFVYPTREFLIDFNSPQKLKSKIKLYCDESGIQKQNRDYLNEVIDAGLYPSHSETLTPFIFDIPESPLDWINVFVKQTNLKTCKYLLIENSIQNESNLSPLNSLKTSLNETISNQYKLALSEGRIVGDPKNIFPSIYKINKSDSATHLESFLFNKEPTKINMGQAIQRVKKAALEEKASVLIVTQSEVLKGQITADFKAEGIDSNHFSFVDGIFNDWIKTNKQKIEVIGANQLTGHQFIPTQKSSSKPDSLPFFNLQNLQVNDYVVHYEHGIGRYLGLTHIDTAGESSEYFLVEYQNNDKLYVPVYRLNTITKYAGSSQNSPVLNKLGEKSGASKFQSVRALAKSNARELAIDLIKLQAERKLKKGPIFSGSADYLGKDGVALEKDFLASFPYKETEDQEKAIQDIYNDLSSGQIMDRIVCGDVGFGKTEVAMRAALRVALSGAQVAVLVPTTILAFQHETTFRKRFSNIPIEIQSLSRMKSKGEQNQLLEKLEKGTLDIIIGTHRLLSKDVKFKNLGLIIIDEEHRFGVEHKELLKDLQKESHVLTLTATPIPRTLHFALAGLKDISIMNTPPYDRLPIKTYVAHYSEATVLEAIHLEVSRGGQVYYLHNRVQTIEKVALFISKNFPQLAVQVAHGQMSQGKLEKILSAFFEGKINVLIATTIIESGLDIPNANTLIVERADTFGLAQLYQIRGRVGRSQKRAYAHFLTAPLTKPNADAKRRLDTLQRHVELGSGFLVASDDLDIRGGGDLLGPKQSGHIADVGFELYLQLLDEAMEALKLNTTENPIGSKNIEPDIRSPFSALLEESYIPNNSLRLNLYKRLSEAKTDGDVRKMETEIVDRFGRMNEKAINLLWIVRIKILLKSNLVEGLTIGRNAFSITSSIAPFDPVKLFAIIAAHPNKYSLSSEKQTDGTTKTKLTVKISSNGLKESYESLVELLNKVVVK